MSTLVEQSKIGNEIDQMALAEKKPSEEQEELFRADFDGRPQLVRGVAGSGKSVVLANNASNCLIRKLRAAKQHPLSLDGAVGSNNRLPRIGIVCFNRTLVSFLQEKVRSAFKQLRLPKPSSSTIDCNYLNGFMYKFCKEARALRYERIDEDNRVLSAIPCNCGPGYS